MKVDLTKISRTALIIIALIGLGISVELSVIYYNANFILNAGPSFCSINEIIDCDSVAKTPYARFLEVPLSLWGLGFYTFILFLILFPFNKFDLFKKLKNPKAYVFTLATLSLIVSLVMAYISSYVLQKVCILCHVLYLINLLLFLVCLAGSSIKELYSNTLQDIKNIFSDQKLSFLLSILAIAGFAILLIINYYKPFTPPGEKDYSSASPLHKYTIGEIGNILGTKDAKIVIKEFTDYECPFCSISNKMMLQLTSELDNIRVEHYDFPLNTECNPSIKHTVHNNACTAIYYARAARKQGKFWDLTTLLFDNQANLTEENILKLAQTIELDIEKLKKDANDPELKKEIEKDIEKAKAFGINGTPSYIIGIKKYEGMMPYFELKRKIESNL